MIIFINILVLAGLATGIWFLTGYDKTMGGESLKDQYLSRAIRTILVVFLSALGLLLAEDHSSGYIGTLYIMAVPFTIALLLRGCISEIFAHGFLRMADPMLGDTGTFDPKKSRRYMDTVAHLIRTGQREQAIKLCEEFKRTGEVDLATLENTLEYLGVKQGPARAVDPMLEARQLRAAGEFAGAENSLRTLLLKRPDHLDAGILLIRIYLEDLHQPAKAGQVLALLETQRHISAPHLDFARRLVREGIRPAEPGPDAAPPEPQTVEDALAQGGLGTAIGMLEAKIQQDPRDFEARLKLMELQAKRCNNFPRAEKILREMEMCGHFSPAQTGGARAELKKWRLESGKS